MTGQDLVIVRGRPDDAELAALTVVLAALASAGVRESDAAREPDAVRPGPRWARPAEVAFGDSWMRPDPETGSSRLRVRLENEPPQWDHWAAE
ncbi:acyl-CoA carboxylase subunit epsilon [Streptosporangiaceae bacterium NEAU-GS5]|nr:acyl-CoA carboxylase subunit epsilon [Streptosporangiaceae bacterium NEAU-GS5]